MLKHFTWQQFLLAASILTFTWYAILLLVIYRKKLFELLSGRPLDEAQTEPLKRDWDEDFEENALEEEDELMGKSALPEGMSKLSMSQFGFAPRLDEDEDNRARQQSVVPDVLEELKSIFHILETQQGSKADFISLFSLVSAKYPEVKGTPNEEALNDYIRENVLFPITDEELGNLWN